MGHPGTFAPSLFMFFFAQQKQESNDSQKFCIDEQYNIFNAFNHKSIFTIRIIH